MTLEGILLEPSPPALNLKAREASLNNSKFDRLGVSEIIVKF